MRMWMIPPKLMCRQHLLGEHVECHMLLGTIRRGKSLDGFVADELIDTAQLKQRHDDLRDEMISRGYNHNSPFDYNDALALGHVNVIRSLGELSRRCSTCAEHIKMSGILFDKNVNDATFNRASKKQLKEAV